LAQKGCRETGDLGGQCILRGRTEERKNMDKKGINEAGQVQGVTPDGANDGDSNTRCGPSSG